MGGRKYTSSPSSSLSEVKWEEEIFPLPLPLEGRKYISSSSSSSLTLTLKIDFIY